MKTYAVIFIITILLPSCSIFHKSRDFDFLMKWGRDQNDGINTFRNEITKDLVMDSSKTFYFKLPWRSKDSIFKILMDIKIFSYPDTLEYFSHKDKNIIYLDDAGYNIEYYLKIKYERHIKEIVWEDINESYFEKALALRNAINKIIKIIENTEEYKSLPEARGGYL